MKTIFFKLTVQDKWNSKPYTIDWEALETRVPGLYITRPVTFEDEKRVPSKKGWNITHSSGYVINPVVIDSLPVAKNFIDWLSSMNWDKPIEYLFERFREYAAVIRFAYEKAVIEKELKSKVEKQELF